MQPVHYNTLTTFIIKLKFKSFHKPKWTYYCGSMLISNFFLNYDWMIAYCLDMGNDFAL